MSVAQVALSHVLTVPCGSFTVATADVGSPGGWVKCILCSLHFLLTAFSSLGKKTEPMGQSSQSTC